ncbi:MAG: hypothetical protein GY711_28165 [bacterium]|nr:hypothetical protein [bacterium]
MRHPSRPSPTWLLFAALLACLFAGCGDDTPSLPPPKVPPTTLEALITDVGEKLHDHADDLEMTDADGPDVRGVLSAITVAMTRVRKPLLDAPVEDQQAAGQLAPALLRVIDVPATTWEWSDADLVDGRREEIRRFLEDVERMLRLVATYGGRDMPSTALDLPGAWKIGDLPAYEIRVRAWREILG